MSEYDTEPVPGLPQHLPEGETLLWQGSPDSKGVARRVLHANAVAVYFAILATVPSVTAVVTGGTVANALMGTARIALVAAVGIGLITMLARAIARTTVYSLTSKRVVMRYGVAFPVTLNIPFNEISAVDCKSFEDGTGEIALSVSGPLRLSYLHLWPNARAWHLENAQPTLRVVPNGAAVAKSIADAMIVAGVAGSQTRQRTAESALAQDRSVPGFASAPA